jgi:lysophospholipase L1-like esterase
MITVRRVSTLVLKVASIALVALVLAEVALQAAALFARGRETAWRPTAAHRILCIGDSHTYGALVPAEDSYPGQLQHLLDEHAPGAYSVVNLGIPGMNTAQVLDRLHAVLGREHPDIVVVWCGVNDAWNRTESAGGVTGSFRIADAVDRSRLYRLFRTWQNDRRIDHVLAHVLSPSGSGQQRYEVIDETSPVAPEHRRVTVVGGDGAEELAFEDTGLRIEPEMEERAARDYRRMVEDARAAGVPIAFVTYPVELDAFRFANRAIRRVAAEYGVPVVESGRSVRRVPEGQREMLWAGHPNGPMYAEIARDVLRVPGRIAGGDEVRCRRPSRGVGRERCVCA